MWLTVQFPEGTVYGPKDTREWEWWIEADENWTVADLCEDIKRSCLVTSTGELAKSIKLQFLGVDLPVDALVTEQFDGAETIEVVVL